MDNTIYIFYIKKINLKKMTTISFTIKCFMGNPRSGKTLSMVADGYETFLNIKYAQLELEKKKKLSKTEKERLNIFQKFSLISNLDLNKKIYGNYEKFTFDKLLKMYENKIPIEFKLILLDDLFKELDAYEFLKKKHRVFTYFIKEIGKKNNILYYVSHYDTDVTKRLRMLTEWFIYCSKGHYNKIELPDKETLQLFTEENDYYELMNDKQLKRMIIHQQYFRTEVDFTNDFQTRKFRKKEEFLEAFQFFKHYDTKEIV